MIEALLLSQNSMAFEQSGLIHSKVVGKYEIVKELPKDANSFNEMFDYADVSGKLRFAYIDSAHKISSSPNKIEKEASAIGGKVGFITARYKGFNFQISTYISQSIGFLNSSKSELNEDFTNTDKDSFSYIAEASINYSSDGFETKLGRIKVETPYANSDDIRMAANTFEGAWAKVEYTDKLNTQLMFLSRWAGYNSQDEDAEASQDKFKDLVSDEAFGMLSASLTYEYAKNSELSFWYNYIDEMSAISYGEVVGIYFIDGDDFHIDYGLQFSNIQELDSSGYGGDVLGLMSIFHYRGAFFGGAYNKAFVKSGKSVIDGFGGGPYYTSLDEATISAISESAPGIDAESFRIGSGYEFKGIGVDGLVVELVYGELYNDIGKIIEKDVILTYDMSDRWYVEATYTNYESTCNNNTFDRALVRVDYKF